MQLGWVDFSAADRERALTVLNALREPGAVDELGIGIVRDGLANLFFPGTSTIQTRAKYFLLVAYMLRDVERGLYAGSVAEVQAALTETERECARRMLAAAPSGTTGIIGSTVLASENWVTTTPSAIYWRGICRYGLLDVADSSMSLREYIAGALARGGTAKLGYQADTGVRGDDRDAEQQPRSQWNLPTYREDWEDDVTIELTAAEAELLRERITRSCPKTLLGYLLENHINPQDYTGEANSFAALTADVAGALARDARFGAEYVNLMHEAARLSHIVYLGRVRYNVLLGTTGEEEKWEQAVAAPVERADIAGVYRYLQARELLNPTPAARQTAEFLTRLQELFSAGDIAGADELIKARELRLKGRARAKLQHPEKYSAQVSDGYLDYRLYNAGRLLTDIYAAEGKNV